MSAPLPSPVSPAAAEPPHVLVVDDDRRLRELVGQYLSNNGFRVTAAADAAEARAKLAGLSFDLLVVDVMMPGEDGVSFVRALRKDSSVPVLMLTAKAETEDRLAGLEGGADDYLAKPFEPKELLLRIGAILRRAPRPAEAPQTLKLGDLAFDVARAELTRDGQPLRLTGTEAALLQTLARRPGAAFARAELAAALTQGSDRAIDVQVTRLRRKLEPDPRLPRYLRTVRGEGYALYPD
ncbi:MAG: response regulator transcription factor [Alphaproteobacteria bacterium]|nr:response regulator transcription factor [Alphaproteobacteria bacterium]